jgi:flavorubredoxin
MDAREIKPGITIMGSQDFDRRLFDELIPLPGGTSYNVYLVKGSDKTALIDTVDPPKRDELLQQLSEVSNIDYLISLHTEQDHSGAIPDVLAAHPETRVISSPKAKSMLVEHLHIDAERISTVEDGQTISLGDSSLEFLHAPWVHWPETMLAHLLPEKILFTCDLFGAHLASTEVYVNDKCRVYEAAKRYYAEIMMPFRTIIAKHLKRLEDYEIDMIAPSHGQVYSDPAFIIDAYRQWVLDPPKRVVVLPYVSMHGSTQLMVDHLIANLVDLEIEVVPFNLTVTDLGKLAEALVEASTVVFGTPTVLTGPHPSMVSAAYLVAALRPKLKRAGIIGSYGWGGKAPDMIQSLTESLKLEWLDPVMVKGVPQEKDLRRIDNLAKALALAMKGDEV